MRKLIHKYLPHPDSVQKIRVLRPFWPFLSHPNLWHLNRRSVAAGVAVGAFAGMAILPVQIIIAAILALVFRVNLPVAILTTLYTNPFTAAPLVYLAYKVGSLFIDGPGATPWVAEVSLSNWRDVFPVFMNWLSSMGAPFMLGALILGLFFALLSYHAINLLWRLHVTRYLARRRKRPGYCGWPHSRRPSSEI